ncbi:hypothetical protein HZ994_05590 [Akkermansiaceae bacterium]|nr:hypothetical protein HZ994_05590 [Akkermansiaceae bacterium]
MIKPHYHCGRCGSLFGSELGHDANRLCGICGQKPGTGVWPSSGPGNGTSLRDDAVASFANKGQALDEGGQRAVRKKKRKNLMLRLVVVWALLMGLAIWWHNRRTGLADKIQGMQVARTDMAEGTLADERIALLTAALPDCHRALGGFLTAGTPEGRNQFVADPIPTAGRMATFYASNPFPSVDAKNIRRVGQEPLKIGDEWVINTRWKEGADGAIFDAVFLRKGGTWQLDWEHFSRYGDHPWALFLAGGGPEEGEFRLLAREVSGDGGADRGGSRLRFELISPVFGKPLETGISSPIFVIERRSDEGILLEAAFAARRDGRSIFGSTMEPMEPDGLIRVRVQVRRGEFGGKRSFELRKVIACHWIESDVTGFDLDELKDDLFGGS